LGYKMGVFLCLGQSIHNMNFSDAISIHTNKHLKSFQSIRELLVKNDKIFLLLGEGQHKIKRKAEQEACKMALDVIEFGSG